MMDNSGVGTNKVYPLRWRCVLGSRRQFLLIRATFNFQGFPLGQLLAAAREARNTAEDISARKNRVWRNRCAFPWTEFRARHVDHGQLRRVFFGNVSQLSPYALLF